MSEMPFQKLDEYAAEASTERGEHPFTEVTHSTSDREAPTHRHDRIPKEAVLTSGSEPSAQNLAELLGSSQLRQAASAALLGNAGKHSFSVNGVEMSLPAYFRMAARLCRQVADRTSMKSEDFENEELAPQFEQQVATPAPGSLANSVGAKGKNGVEDVKLVQHLLNANWPLPQAPLSENGTLNAATVSAIENFQRIALGQAAPDGRVDPRGETFAALTADKFSLLPHCVQPPGGGPVVAVSATSMNPGFLTSTGVTRNPGLQAIVERRILSKSTELEKLRFALVDLTDPAKLTAPQFAGNRETEQGGLGSTSKLACMYAAYQLKFDLEEISRRSGITDEKILFDAARALWKDSQKPDPVHNTTLFPSDPKIEQMGKLIVIDGKAVHLPSGLSVPKLERIFTSVPGTEGGLTLRFKGSEQILVDPTIPGSPPDETAKVRSYVDADGEDLREVRKLTFAERLFLLLDVSDDAAAHSCVEDVSFEYIASALWQSAIYSVQRGGGLWEASTHDKPFNKRWIKPPVPRSNPRTDFVSATACSVAAVLTLLEQDRLVNRDASAGMKHLISKMKTGVAGGSHTRSYFLEGLEPLFTLDRFHSKLGIGDFRYDAAIVVRTVHSGSGADKQIRYVAAGFDEAIPTTPNLHALIVALDKCILENNGLLAASAPLGNLVRRWPDHLKGRRYSMPGNQIQTDELEELIVDESPFIRRPPATLPWKKSDRRGGSGTGTTLEGPFLHAEHEYDRPLGEKRSRPCRQCGCNAFRTQLGPHLSAADGIGFKIGRSTGFPCGACGRQANRKFC